MCVVLVFVDCCLLCVACCGLWLFDIRCVRFVLMFVVACFRRLLVCVVCSSLLVVRCWLRCAVCLVVGCWLWVLFNVLFVV